MKIAALCLLSLLAAAPRAAAQISKKAAKFAGPRDPAVEYWEREGFPMQNRWYGNVDFSAKNVDELTEKVEKTMAAEGAKLQSVNTFNPNQQQCQPVLQRARRQFTYRVPAAKADAIVNKLTAMAPVENFNTARGNQTPQQDSAQEIQSRIDAIGAEMEANKAALEKMPVARALYASKLERLKRCLQPQTDGDEVQLNVSVTEAAK